MRLRRFLSAVASGYALLLINTLYVLAAVPLALHYLEKREFGLWALAMQLTGYLQLVDLGMSASVSRHLIDHKDDRSSGAYGSMVKTGFLVLLVQGALVLLSAFLFIYFGTGFLRIDADLDHSFRFVMLVQCAIVAADFPARMVGHMLTAHQRTDITNAAQIVMFGITFVGLWFFFAHGFGILSLAWANLIGWAGIVLTNFVACWILKLFPSIGGAGSASWQKFKELFGYGKDVFWIALGTQMINASQSIVITRVLGLNSAAVWSVCTRTFTLVNQLIWRPFDYSYPMLSEMLVRNERAHLLGRFRGLVTVSTSLAVVGAVMFAMCNQPFVSIWAGNALGWQVQTDVLLGAWMIVLALVHCHSGLVLITKRIRLMRYIYFIEGGVFLISGSYAARFFGFSGLVAASLICSLTFSLSYGMRRSAREFDLSLKDVAWKWLYPAAEVLIAMTVLALVLFWSTRLLKPPLKLVMYVTILGSTGAFLLLRRGLGQELSDELRHRVPPTVSRVLGKILPGPASSSPAEQLFP